MANDLVLKLSETLNLDELITFDLLEAYFSTNDSTRRILVYLKTIDMNITQAESQLPSQNPLSNMQLMQQRLRNIDTWTQEYKTCVTQALNEAQIVYFQERNAMLQIILAIIQNPGTQDSKPSQLIKDLLTDRHLESNLLETLHRNHSMIEVFIGFTCSIKDATSYLQREELLILQILSKLYHSYQIPRVTSFVYFLNYQSKTRYQGLRLRQQVAFSSDPILQTQSQQIYSASVILIMLYLQLPLFSAATIQDLMGNERLGKYLTQIATNLIEFRELTKFLKEQKSLDGIDCVIYLTLKQQIEVIEKLQLLNKTNGAAVNVKQASDFLEEWRPLKERAKEIDSDTQFMGVIKQVREGAQEGLSIQGGDEGITAGLQGLHEDVHIIIQEWINLVYPFLKEKRLVEALQMCQDMTFEVISTPIHLKKVWATLVGKIPAGQTQGNVQVVIGKPKGPLLNKDKILYNTLDIFENILESPFEPDTYFQFLQLLIALCGTRHHPQGIQVLNLLQSSYLENLDLQSVNREDYINPRWSIMQYLIFQWMQYTKNIEEQPISSYEDQEYLHLTKLIGTMISQNYLIYPELNGEVIIVMTEIEQNFDDDRSLKQPKDRIDELAKQDPLLQYLIRSYHSIVIRLGGSGQYINEAVLALVDSLTNIYKNLEMQSLILRLLQEQSNEFGIPIFLSYFNANLEQFDYPNQNYVISRAYLRFVTIIFEKSDPFEFLPSISDRTSPSESIVGKFLIQIYQLLLQNFTKLQFSDLSEFYETYYSVLKVTHILLKKFIDINPAIKTPIAHRYPQYDELLRLVSEILNSESVESMIVNSLMLSEETLRGGQTTGITNKFWVDHLKYQNSGASSIKDHDHSTNRIKVQKMIQISIQCLNTLVELSKLQIETTLLSTEQKANIGAKHFYIGKLNCVRNITNLIKYPGQWELYAIQTPGTSASGGAVATLQYSLFNIVQYYVKPHLHLCPFLSQFQLEAIRFLVLCCQIWQTQPLGERVSLESTLRTVGFDGSDIRLRYVTNFRACLRVSGGSTLPLQYLSTFFDLLIISAGTQQAFVMDMFKEQQFVQAINEEMIKKSFREQVLKSNKANEENTAIKALLQEVESKLIILISELATNKICDGFLRQLSQNDDYVRLYQLIIRPSLDEANRLPLYDFSGELSQNRLLQDSIDISNNSRSLAVFQSCLGLITVKYYLKLLQEEYARDINSMGIKRALVTIADNMFTQTIKAESTKQFEEIVKKVGYITIELVRYERNKSYIRSYQQNVERKLTQDQVELMKSVDSKVRTNDECPIGLVNLDCSQLHNFVVKKCHQAPFELLKIQELNFNTPSAFGTAFSINIEEVSYLASTYFYDNQDLLIELRSQLGAFNLSLSHLAAYQLYIIGIKDFLLSIGRTRMRENLRHRDLVLENKTFSTSLFNLASTPSVGDQESKNPAFISATQGRIANLLIDIARPLTKRLSGTDGLVLQIGRGINQMIQGSILMGRFDEQNATNINSFELAENEIELELLTVLLGSLNAIGELGAFSNEILKKLDNEVIGNLIKGLPRIRQNQISSINKKDISQMIRLQNERETAKLFINIVLQIFSLSQQIQDSKQNGKESFSQQSEIEYIQILSQVVKAMQDPSNGCFIDGLKIIEQALNLLGSESLIIFMKKQDTSPLKVILTRFLSNSSNIEEKIKVVEFLTSYARIQSGAQHLFSESIIKNLGMGNLVSLVNQIDFYQVEAGEQVPRRNSIHILWCHILLFLRTLNHIMMPSSPDYRRSISAQISSYWSRLGALLEFGLHLKEKQFDSKSMSLALYEELELLTGLVSQYFEFSDEIYSQDFKYYTEIKDRLLFGVLYLFTEDDASSYSNPSSSAEHYLAGMQHEKIVSGLLRRGKYSGLDLACDRQRIKIWFNIMSALLNATLINQSGIIYDDIINTWDPAPRDEKESKRGSKSGSFFLKTGGEEFTPFKSISHLTSCISSINLAMQNMSTMFKLWIGGSAQSLEQLHENMSKIFINDEWINTREYIGGINSYFAGGSFIELLETFEQSLQMSFLVSAMLLRKLKEVFDDADQQGYLYTSSGQAVSLKKILDFGDQICQIQRSIENDMKQPSIPLKPSAKENHKAIQDFVKALGKGKGGTLGGESQRFNQSYSKYF